MQLYAGLDLHSRNTYIGIMDKEFKGDFSDISALSGSNPGNCRRIHFQLVLLIDGLMDAGYQCVHLVNPSAMKQYENLKHTEVYTLYCTSFGEF